jgi:hypothetical protein
MNEKFEELKLKCMDEMTEVVRKYEEQVRKEGLDHIEFSYIILEQWRPW